MAADNDGKTPLYSASESGDLESVAMLLEAGADPNQATTEKILSNHGNSWHKDAGLTPLLVASQKGHFEIMKRLVDAGANPKARTQDGATLLMQAARSTRMSVIAYAYSLDNNVTAKTSANRTVMHSVVMPGGRNEDDICNVIQFLSKHGADPDPQGKGGWTPISMADRVPYEKAARLLYELTMAAGQKPTILPTEFR